MKKKFLSIILIVFISLVTLTGCEFLSSTETTTTQKITEAEIDYQSIINDIYSKVYEQVEDSLYSQIYSEIKSEFLDGKVDTDSLQNMIKETVDKSQATNVYVLRYTKKDDVDSASASGSGVVFLKETGTEKAYRYYLITNHHVINGGSKYTIQYGDNEALIDATLVGSDEATDLALLYFESDLTYATATLGDSSKVEVGDVVIACGNPKGITLYNSITMGIVGGVERNLLDDDGSVNTRNEYIQHDAAINSGNSGGGLYNMDGELIGINSVKYASSDIEGLNFSIPVNLVKEVINEIKETGHYDGTVSLGVSCYNVSSFNAAGRVYYNIPDTVTEGIFIVQVTAGSTSDGIILPNDIIIECDGHAVATSDDLKPILDSHRIGDTIDVKVIRAGVETTVQITFKRVTTTTTE